MNKDTKGDNSLLLTLLKFTELSLNYNEKTDFLFYLPKMEI